jgi:hypothetical protein
VFSDDVPCPGAGEKSKVLWSDAVGSRGVGKSVSFHVRLFGRGGACLLPRKWDAR